MSHTTYSSRVQTTDPVLMKPEAASAWARREGSESRGCGVKATRLRQKILRVKIQGRASVPVLARDCVLSLLLPHTLRACPLAPTELRGPPLHQAGDTQAARRAQSNRAQPPGGDPGGKAGPSTVNLQEQRAWPRGQQACSQAPERAPPPRGGPRPTAVHPLLWPLGPGPWARSAWPSLHTKALAGLGQLLCQRDHRASQWRPRCTGPSWPEVIPTPPSSPKGPREHRHPAGSLPTSEEEGRELDSSSC